MENNTDLDTDETPKLDLKDLIAAAQVIDLAASRGAIKGDEMAEIGSLRRRIVAFVSAHTPRTPEESADKPTAEKPN